MSLPLASSEDANVIFNRANVALARSQRLVASWLPAETDHASKKSEEELQREEDELFTPVPEKLGLGAKVLPNNPASDSINSTERLRKQLLGRNAVQPQAKGDIKAKTGLRSHVTPRDGGSSIPKGAENDDDDQDNEKGRSSLGKRKKRFQKAPAKQDDMDSDEDGAESRTKSSRGRATSYLDEVLAERAKKRKKKSAKNNNK